MTRFAQQTNEFIALRLLRESNGKFMLTRKGKMLADSVAEAFVESSEGGSGQVDGASVAKSPALC
jgi:coproporphyrinogen III oxidase-like Fe-S oxidoreductase